MAKPGPGEGMPPHDFFGQAQRLAHGAHLVLEQHAQRLDELKRHVRGQAAHVVMRLDCARMAGVVVAGRLDHVRVERALHQECGIVHAPLRGQARRFGFEDADEARADQLALCLRVGHVRPGR